VHLKSPNNSTRSPEAELAELHAADLLRTLRPLDSAQGTEVISADGRTMINFASNDYLGLATHPALKNAACDATEKWGVGAGASRLVCGTLPPHRDLESALAAFKNTEAALVFSTGYATAVGTLTAIAGKNDILILDKLCHASLVDGARLSGATLRIFPHNDLDKLQSHLDWANKTIVNHGRVIVIVESIYSMDGDTSPLTEIVEMKTRSGALLLVDEAHAVGLCGPHGKGYAASLACDQDIDLQMGTLSKALGGSGGYLCASQAWVDLIINRARSFIYSTAPSPAVCAVASAAITLIQSAEGEQRRAKLRANAQRLRDILGQTSDSPSAIVPWIVGENHRALAIAAQLGDAGILAPAIRFPTVPKNTARIRFTATADHGDAQLNTLAKAITKLKS